MTTAPFTVKRRTAWGDCDPARIYYTPRAVDYAVEAIEAWYEAVLGISWAELAEHSDLNVRFIRVDCDYHRPLAASQVAHLQVWVTGVECSHVTLTVIGEDGDKALCFLARLVCHFVERSNAIAIPIPAEFRQRIESYKDKCGDAIATVKNGNRSGLVSARSAGGSETDVSGCNCLPDGRAPFSRQRRVVYGDCDASGMLYAPRVFYYAIETVEEWYEEILGISWMDLVCKHEQGAPFVSVSCEYLQPIFPGQTLTVTVRVTRLGAASLGFAVVGYDAWGSACFDAHLAACFIEQDGFKTMRIPEVYRVRIQAYQSICEALEGNEASLA
ncbi:MAG: thioesterase family protein [Desulfuromonadales bacterium]|nr:thioesterase family protein [Desulfuromonadales bacterium]